jgi:hypothetical protein
MFAMSVSFVHEDAPARVSPAEARGVERKSASELKKTARRSSYATPKEFQHVGQSVAQ